MIPRKVQDILLELRKRNVSIHVDGDRLRISAPKGALDPSLRDAIKRSKSFILRFILGAHRSVPPIEPVSRAGVLPLSFAQDRLWFLDQLEPGSAGYNMPLSVRLTGPLDSGALQKSLAELVRRHEVLRTRLPAKDGEPHQVIEGDLPVMVAQVDLSDLSGSAQAQALERLVCEEVQRAFDLAQGPLMRARLFRLGPPEHVLVLTLHHIVSDGWSLGVLYRELGSLYGAFRRGEPSPLEPLPVQYVDFSVWQRKWLQGAVLEEQLGYWGERLEGLETLELPTDRPRPAMQTYNGAREVLVIAPTLSAQLKALAQREGATLFMVLLAAFKVLLQRYTGQDDLVVGSPIANRNRAEIEGLIGFFINILVLRTDLADDPSFVELLARVRETALGAYSHQDLPFEKLVQELRPARDISRNPFFQIFFALQNAPLAPLALEGLTLRPEPVGSETTRFDLEVHIWEVPEGLETWFIYNIDLFEADTIRRLVGHYQRLLEAIAAEPEGRLSAYALMSEAERQQLLVEWNDTGTKYPREATIQALFEAQVERTPEAVAMVFEGQELTYKQLNARANQLAHYLRRQGVGPEGRVGICLPRSLDMSVAVLATLKAGGAYVPLDPDYPVERLGVMAADADLCVLLTISGLQPHIPGPDAQRIFLDNEDGAWRKETRENLAIEGDPRQAAYVIYTSGSTGVPKGIVMEHGVLCNLVQWQCSHGYANAAARTLQFTSLSFDVSFQEMFSTWCAGGALVLVSSELRRDPIALLRFMDKERIERLFLPFAALQQLAETVAYSERVPGSLREVVTAGEQLRITPAIATWFRAMPNCVLENQYGPSESHVVTSFRLVGVPGNWLAVPPIGRPITNARIYVLDPTGEPVPVGVPGELYIGGVSVARGYLKAPELTRERFLPDPFSHQPDSLMYRTGDRVRYCADGELEFLGRWDDQVKVRGYRVEPGEVEAVLSAHPKVRNVAVVAPKDESGSRRLVAYYVPRGEYDVSGNELKEFLRNKLPDYLLPSLFLPLNEMPLMNSGKVDRRHLSALELERMPEAQYIAPRTDVEQALVSIWAEVLGVERVGIQDDFFDLGGHSLLGIQLVSRIENRLGISLPLPALFRFSTIREMASAIDTGAVNDGSRGFEAPDGERSGAGLSDMEYRKMLEVVAGCRVTPVGPGSLMIGLHVDGREPPLFWCFNALSEEAPSLARELGVEQPLYGLFSGSKVVSQDEGWRRRVASHYVEEITKLKPVGPYRLGGNCGGGWVACEIASKLLEQGYEVERLCVMEYFEPRLFNYPAPLQILFSLESCMRVWERFHWNESGWKKQFRTIPSADIISGPHSSFFTESNVKVLGKKVQRFLRHGVANE